MRADTLLSVNSDSYYSLDREDVVGFVQRTVPVRGRVLDIGCASGAVGARLLSLGFESVWGVEANDDAARSAEGKLTHVLNARFPCEGVDEGGPYDLIVMADSLEHMADPWHVLETTRALLARDGHLVLSLPNVCHFSVMLEQAKGRWHYASEGILDRTHLRFFSPESAVALLSEAGYVAESVETTCALPRRRWTPATLLAQRFLPHLLVFQFRLVARLAR